MHAKRCIKIQSKIYIIAKYFYFKFANFYASKVEQRRTEKSEPRVNVKKEKK